ncbi:hypothetical protein TNCV_261481 [Trichonephila clavipes]|nr:hypothetical protein TNCV_261481 [Trichonephila clavipes]
MLSETWLLNEELVETENFKRITQYRRDFVKRNTCTYINQTKSNLGDICVAGYTLPNGKPIVVVTVYDSVNQNVTDVIDYNPETLLAYTEGGSKLHALPLIPGGNFNTDFEKDEGLRLVQFLKSDFNLGFVSGKALGANRYGTTIDEMFSRFVNHG